MAVFGISKCACVSLIRRSSRLNGLFGIRSTTVIQQCYKSIDASDEDSEAKGGVRKGKTPIGRLDDKWEGKSDKMQPQERPVLSEEEVYAPFPDNTNPETGEIGGPKGPEPTRYGDWERKGRVIDF